MREKRGWWKKEEVRERLKRERMKVKRVKEIKGKIERRKQRHDLAALIIICSLALTR